MKRRARPSVITLCALLAGSPPCGAGPPFLTDDPVPVDLGHHEFYLFATRDHVSQTSAIAAPSIEYNRAIGAEAQMHIGVPVAWNVPAHGSAIGGIGDIELGIKYRFVSAGGLQAGLFPMIELATGSARRGLGNGSTWYRLPLWVQKSEGAWTFNGGGGVIVNPARGMRNPSFGGVLAQYAFSPRWTLGSELFRQNALAADQPGYTLLNAGGYFNASQNFSVLFSVGASVAGAPHTVAYLGLYWTWATPERSAWEH